MKINHAGQRRLSPIVLSLAILAGCAPIPQAAPPPPPAPAPTVQPAPPPRAPEAPAWRDWRDAPVTPGGWRYSAETGGSAARFVDPAGAVLITLRCTGATRTVSLLRAGTAATAVPASITTSTGVKQLGASPATEGGAPVMAIAFAAGDAQLDAMAFSRGRFLVEVNGLPTLVLPAWAEVGRVIEDCR
ncbi:hypothetical protein [Novosphingobium cyanobacteriorum]|uniref:Lipoprotein n=1 Tax=Novosphingobium cyanobacteriorum TaxID=3024215 RepID=A0ABT6CGP7_9SPHN|nr:hypothetical protein [Novosphingobium cyanobacteriorum]MDF8332689.1 hypothetical protein [Novosphingobium cyanobacteriorum]